jgi:tellurite resistance protein TehA-like permease
MDRTPITVATHSLVEGLAVVLWAFGSWLVPLLVVFSLWRFRVFKTLHYAPPLWSVVFPLGMYAAASLEIGTAEALPVVTSIGRAAAWVAAVVWLLVFVGMLHRLVTVTVASLRG